MISVVYWKLPDPPSVFLHRWHISSAVNAAKTICSSQVPFRLRVSFSDGEVHHHPHFHQEPSIRKLKWPSHPGAELNTSQCVRDFASNCPDRRYQRRVLKLQNLWPKKGDPWFPTELLANRLLNNFQCNCHHFLCCNLRTATLAPKSIFFI